MKFLCLHGNGTNSSVLKVQTSALRHELEDDQHEYEFLEAAVECPMAPGVETLVSPNQTFYGYYNPRELATLSTCIDQLDDYVSAEGPFDAVMGFSTGAVLAAMYMVVKQRREGAIPFQCAIFLSSASNDAEMRYLKVDLGRDKLQIPTAHIWGSADDIAPTGGPDLSHLCDLSKRYELVHNAGHELPRNRFETEIVQVVRRVTYEVR